MVGDSTALDTVPLPAHTLVREELFMVYLIMCRSLTYAQRVSNALERAGIPARNLARALTILNGTRLPYLGIYVNAAGYGYREVEL